MDNIGLWQIQTGRPIRLQETEVGLERDLEDWIEQDPGLLERGLVIVGRQMRLAGGPLDLLALDPLGRWVLIEIKRTLLTREAVAQAIDYASCLRALDHEQLRENCDAYLRSKAAPHMLNALLEERGRTPGSDSDGRELIIYLVGTGSDSRMERIASFLGEEGKLAIKLVTYSVFREAQGTTLLSREIHEPAEVSSQAPRQPATVPKSPDAAFALADQNGIGDVVRVLFKAATDVGLHPRLFSGSIMFAPPANKTWCLFAVWLTRFQREPGVAKVYISAEAFQRFYGIGPDAVTAALGAGEHVRVDVARATVLATALRNLLTPKER